MSFGVPGPGPESSPTLGGTSPTPQPQVPPQAGGLTPPYSGQDFVSNPLPPNAPQLPYQPGQYPPPPPPTSRRPKWLFPAIGGVVLVALIAGLLVWQPWNPSPNAPASLSGTSPTGTTVTLSWPAAKGGATAADYLIFQPNGTQVGEVPASQTTWTGTGLTPGTKYQYEVKTDGGGKDSGPSPIATVTTLAPPPTGVTATATYTTVTLNWKPSSLGPTPSQYTLLNGGNVVATLPGTTTSYTATGQSTNSPFQFTVVSHWGSHASAPSSSTTGSTLSAPLNDSAANVTVTPTSVPSGATGATIGTGFPFTWSFSPSCTVSDCTLSTSANVPTSGNHYYPFTVTLRGSGPHLSGTTTTQFSTCNTAATNDTVRVNLSTNAATISNGAWAAWSGTIAISSPYTTASGGYFCPAETWNFTVKG
jgi:Fibronectin type III domain